MELLKKILTFFGLKIIHTKQKRLNKDIITLETYKKYFPEDSIKYRRFYNLGAGKFRHPYWTNIDKTSDWYKNIQEKEGFIDYDFFSMEKLPIDSNSAELFYSSHAIEHIPNEEVLFLFKEAYRALVNGGTFRITCPNIDLDYRSLVGQDLDFFYFRNSPVLNKNKTFDMSVDEMDIEQAFVWHVASNASIHHTDGAENKISSQELRKIIANNTKENALDIMTARADVSKQKLYPGNHINWFNHKKLTTFLEEAGFTTINNEGYGQSNSPVLRDISLFDHTHPKLSLYVEAIK